MRHAALGGAHSSRAQVAAGLTLLLAALFGAPASGLAQGGALPAAPPDTAPAEAPVAPDLTEPPADASDPTAIPAPAAADSAADSPEPAPAEAIAAVEAHFEAIVGKDYRSADSWFSQAYLDAFKADVDKTNQYYLARYAQLSRGYSVVESALLQDPGRRTARVTVDFNPPQPDAPVLITERMHYYLIWEKGADGTPGRDTEGRAWRIEIYDAFRHESLAEARRRPYLYTRQAWAEDGGRALKSRQGLFRLQWALDSYAADRGGYPERLVGGDSLKDPLISGNYFTGVYPPNGWDNAAMAAVNLDERSSGDFTYIPLDGDGDGRFDDYWLLLHGKLPQSYYFEGTDIIYVLSAAADADQRELGQAFAAYWAAARQQDLADGPGLLALAPAEVLAQVGAQTQADPAAPASADGPEASGSPAEAMEPAGAPPPGTDAGVGEPSAPPDSAQRGRQAGAMVLACRDKLLAKLSGSAPSEAASDVSAVKAWIPGAGDYPPLDVWSYGFR